MDKSPTNEFRTTILELILSTPGISYNDLIRATKFNHGVLSYSLVILEKKSLVKSFTSSKGSITRYYSSSIREEYLPIIGYLKNRTTRKIILFLYHNKEKNFTEIKNFVDRASSTTSWNIKRLFVDNILIRKKDNKRLLFV